MKQYFLDNHQIITSDILCKELIILKRHKKKRINKKWNKKYGNKTFCVKCGDVFYADNKFIVDSKTFRKLKKTNKLKEINL